MSRKERCAPGNIPGSQLENESVLSVLLCVQADEASSVRRLLEKGSKEQIEEASRAMLHLMSDCSTNRGMANLLQFSDAGIFSTVGLFLKMASEQGPEDEISSLDSCVSPESIRNFQAWVFQNLFGIWPCWGFHFQGFQNLFFAGLHCVVDNEFVGRWANLDCSFLQSAVYVCLSWPSKQAWLSCWPSLKLWDFGLTAKGHFGMCKTAASFL